MTVNQSMFRLSLRSSAKNSGVGGEKRQNFLSQRKIVSVPNELYLCMHIVLCLCFSLLVRVAVIRILQI